MNKTDNQIIKLFEEYFAQTKIEQRDGFRARKAINPDKAALFVLGKLNEGVNARDAIVWLNDYFVVITPETAKVEWERKALDQLTKMVEPFEVEPQADETVMNDEPKPKQKSKSQQKREAVMAEAAAKEQTSEPKPKAKKSKK